jgi:hypothetical protein
MDMSFQHADEFHENNLVTVDAAAIPNRPATRTCQHHPCAQNRRDHYFHQNHFLKHRLFFRASCPLSNCLSVKFNASQQDFHL